MTRRAIILVASLLAITFMQADSMSAQIRRDPSRLVPLNPLDLTSPIVLAGPDVGFRLIRMDGPIPVGQIVVRIDGVWLAAEVAR